MACSNKDSARRLKSALAVEIIEDSYGITLWADLPVVPHGEPDLNGQDGRLYIDAEALCPRQAICGCTMQRLALLSARAFTLSEDSILPRSMQICRVVCCNSASRVDQLEFCRPERLGFQLLFRIPRRLLFAA